MGTTESNLSILFKTATLSVIKIGALKLADYILMTTLPGIMEPPYPPVDLYLNSEKLIWKNQVRRSGFLAYFELDFY